MARYALLLRGVNVGGNKKIAMAELRDLLAGCGYTEVATLLQSGNAVFTVAGNPARDKVIATIEAAVAERFGTTVRCILRTRDELQAIVEENPLAEVADNPSRYLVVFLAEAAPKGLGEELDADAYRPDEFRVGRSEVYLWLPGGIADSKLGDYFVGRKAPVLGTGRNWNTLLKLLKAL
ncbi:DUF1697 domain-containing protein [Hamadaea tsunoensis]|uniref:DUF1697 domain-containing protein n=1 Tax=Hamadaea tsunoensis TaxID=53368 RepID=UPI0003F9C3B5|nr:DUF1697 domain-containing protein [Hamadaea tsunoensis]